MEKNTTQNMATLFLKGTEIFMEGNPLMRKDGCIMPQANGPGNYTIHKGHVYCGG
jgi:hypothetical protein